MLPLCLQVPLALLALNGSEPLQPPQQPIVGVNQTSSGDTTTRETSRRPPLAVFGTVARCIALLGAWLLALLLLSDVRLRRFPQHQCLLPRLTDALGGGVPPAAVTSPAVNRSSLASLAAASPLATDSASQGCWLHVVHGYALSVEDLTPNVGVFWYFFTHMFANLRPFFAFVLHSQAALFVLPLALRFPRRPLLLLALQLLANALLRPYPSIADWALLPPLALLLQPQFAALQFKMLFLNVFLALAAVAPAVWHQWVVADAGNANFVFWCCLVLAVLLVALHRQLLATATPPEKAAQS